MGEGRVGGVGEIEGIFLCGEWYSSEDVPGGKVECELLYSKAFVKFSILQP